MAARSKGFIEFDVDWGETRPNEGRYARIICQQCIQLDNNDACVLTIVMVYGFCLKGYQKQCIQQVPLEGENNILVATTETNEYTDPILNCGPLDLDTPPNGELMYILVIIIEVSIYWVFLMHMS